MTLPVITESLLYISWTLGCMYTHTLVRIGYSFIHSIDIPLSFPFTLLVLSVHQLEVYIYIGLCMNVKIGSSSSYNHITGLY